MITKLEARQRWVRKIIAEACGDDLVEFAGRMGMSDSYVRRMLYPKGKKDAKGIGDAKVYEIAEKFPNSGLPDEPLFQTRGANGLPSHDKDTVAAQMVFEALIGAVIENLPAAKPAFSARLRALAAAAEFSTKVGLLGDVLDIVEPGHRSAEDSRMHEDAGDSPRARKRGT